MQLTIRGLLKKAVPCITVLVFSCAGSSSSFDDRDYREEMRQFVIDLSVYAEASHSDFIIIPQNGQELITTNDSPDGPVHRDYVDAIDGTGREDLFYGYKEDNQATPAEERDYLLDYCKLFEEEGIQVLVTDYCWDTAKVDESYNKSAGYNFISYAAPDRDLQLIPSYPSPIKNENSADIVSLIEARNFLYLINGEDYSDQDSLVAAVAATNYDVILLDLYQADQIWDPADITAMKTKQNGGNRLVICYMSIGEAEDYRYYWKDFWKKNPPQWLEEENPSWEGNYKVRYWDSDWQDIIYSGENAYLDKILSVGFDGVYLDIIDAFEYFE